MLRTLVTLALLVLSLSACQKQDGPPAAAPKAEAKPPAAPGPRAEAAEWEVSLSAPGAVDAGTEGALQVRVVARPGYKVNKDYPLAFKPDAPPAGLSFPAPRIELLEKAALSPCAKDPSDSCEAQAQVPFTAASPGKHRAAGVLSFSVCNPEKCLVEKASLVAEVDAR